MQKDDSKGQARTADDSEQKDQDLSVSQHIRKPNVVCSPSVQPQPENKASDSDNIYEKFRKTGLLSGWT